MKKLIVGNLKMNMESVSQRNTYCTEYLQEAASLKTEHDVVICPPHVYVEYFSRTLGKTVNIGAQDCFWELYGSYTGNTSPKALHSLGARYVIIGHSEHRLYDHETDDDVAKKVKMALRVGLTPIVCVGFLSHGDEAMSVRSQVDSIVDVCSADEIAKVVFAYEPVWAIGTGRTPTSDEIHSVIMIIRSIFVHAYGKDVTKGIRILYGGSVTAENVTEVCTKAYADGVLVGRASLSPEGFMRIVRMLH